MAEAIGIRGLGIRYVTHPPPAVVACPQLVEQSLHETHTDKWQSLPSTTAVPRAVLVGKTFSKQSKITKAQAPSLRPPCRCCPQAS